MRILIELPSWLGDTVMATPAIDFIANFFNESEIFLIGSSIAIDVLKGHPKVKATYVLDKNYISMFNSINGLDEFELFFSFRSSFRSRLMKFFIKSIKKYQFNKNISTNCHQVEKYNNFIKDSLNVSLIPSELKLPIQKKCTSSNKKLLGINPGASYGSAKRWYPEEFANVAVALSSQYDVIIYGGNDEKDIANDIEKHLIKNGVLNYQNLSAQTSISELFSQIANLDLFITGDSGPMHVASAYKIPTVAIFGPTNDKETSQWMNENGKIIKRSLSCQPCMKRKCPLKHHKCMKSIKSQEVLEAITLIT
jgi:heptosyltransferase II